MSQNTGSADIQTPGSSSTSTFNQLVKMSVKEKKKAGVTGIIGSKTEKGKQDNNQQIVNERPISANLLRTLAQKNLGIYKF